MRITPVYSFQNYSQTQKSKDNNKSVAPALSNNNDVAFTGNPFKSLINIFDVWNPKVTPLERLQHLAEEAQNNSRPLHNAIHRGDFKGVIPKEKIIEIIKSELDKAEYTATKQGYQRLIDSINKKY